ncbi:hypothetical protein QQF64_033860 [Cirrhinus molitorella]|uniref:ATP-dependent DNA helicase n=1 Tax=Cirrhinus molitorella TaxID=172907 RepID=A0ABR3MV36_9TELE
MNKALKLNTSHHVTSYDCYNTEATKILRQLPRLQEEGDLSMPTMPLSAFTGTAAFNISGKTLHSLLKLPRSLKPPYQGLGNSLDKVRAGLRDVEILIINEVSMISKDLFAYIIWRFQQIKGSKKPFGGISHLAVGDYYQLPLLGKAKPLCVFEEDAVKKPKDCLRDAPHIFVTNKEVQKYNTKTVQAPYTDIITIDAEVAVGVRVMVTKNLDLEHGIVNGCFDKIANIVTKTKDGIATVQMLGLQLDNPNAGQKHRKKVGGEEDVLVYIERNRHVSMSEKIKCECNTDDDELDTSLCANFFQVSSLYPMSDPAARWREMLLYTTNCI